MKIYQLDGFNFWTDVERSVGPRDPCPKGYIRSVVPPPQKEGKTARWIGGGWVLARSPDRYKQYL